MDYNYIKKTVFDIVDFKDDIEIEFYDFDGLKVEFEGGKAKIGANRPERVARGCFLLAMNISEGKDSFEISEEPVFETLGVMLDCSRNGVTTVEATKKYIDCMATLGFNMLLLYTEDTYEVPERPRFGYMRGRYTEAELKEISAYGDKMGVELVPHIQTLGHLDQYLKWSRPGAPDYNDEHIYQMTDTGGVLLCDCDETYKFIEEMIAACRRGFTSNKIHLGMDEAYSMGNGQYKKLHGECNRIEVMTRHLNRVVEIAKKYGFEPMTYSDMFIKLADNSANYCDKDAGFSKNLAEQLPECELIYWNYYRDYQEIYDQMIEKHQALGQKLSFYGGVGTWFGFVPHARFTLRHTYPALKSCVEHGIKSVVATAWAGGGCETNFFLANTLLPIYSEYCYRGIDCPMEHIEKVSEYFTQIKYSDTEIIADFNYDTEHTPEKYVYGKRLFYGDVLYDLAIDADIAHEAVEKYTNGANRMAELMELQDKNYNAYNYYYLLFEIGKRKAELAQNLRKAYKSGNKEYLNKAAYEILPDTVELFEQFKIVYKAQWESTFKPFGYEVISFRIGGCMARLMDAIDTLDRYLTGEISKIDELEAEAMVSEAGYNAQAKFTITPTYAI